MAGVFNWIRPGYDLVKMNISWNVQIPLLKTGNKKIEDICSDLYSSQDECHKWQLYLTNENSKTLAICLFHFDSAEDGAKIDDPVLVKISILNEKGQKVLQQMIASEPNTDFVEFFLTKEDLIKPQCQQADGSYTFCCTIFSHVKKEPFSSADSQGFAMDCSSELMTQLEGLFDSMQFSDVIFHIGGREFPAHKSILAARSEIFAAMFQHQTKENLTNQISIEDIEPEIFKELLRFIYTGRLRKTTMETMAAGLLIAGDKYLLINLRNECENYLLRQMSPVNCVELVLRCDLLNPAEHLKEVLKEAAKYFRRLQSEVMATAKWEKMEEENPRLLLKVQKILLRKD
jgi:speckle-type POZ protein